MKDHDPCFAIVRLEEPCSGEDQVTVKLVTWTKEDADREVERLNTVNAGKRCRYFWLATRARRRADA